MPLLCPPIMEDLSTDSAPTRALALSPEHGASHLEADRLTKECSKEQDNAGGTLHSAVDRSPHQKIQAQGKQFANRTAWFQLPDPERGSLSLSSADQRTGNTHGIS